MGWCELTWSGNRSFKGQNTLLYGFFLALNCLDWVVFVSIYDRHGIYKYGWHLIFLTVVHGYTQTLYWIVALVDNAIYHKSLDSFGWAETSAHFHRFRDSFFVSLIAPLGTFVGIGFLALIHWFGTTPIQHWRATYQHVFLMIWSWIELWVVQHRYRDATRTKLFIQSLIPAVFAVVYLAWNLSISQVNGGYPYPFQQGLTIGVAVGLYTFLVLSAWVLFFVMRVLTYKVHGNLPPAEDITSPVHNRDNENFPLNRDHDSSPSR